MNKLLRPACLLLYVLVILDFFFLGMLYAGLIGAGENQGLAAGAIVMGYGVIAAVIAFLAALVTVYKTSIATVVQMNKILGLILLGFAVFMVYRLTSRDANPSGAIYKNQARTRVAPVQSSQKIQATKPAEMGLGVFSPDFFEREVVYFYGDIRIEKPVSEHSPVDSITFRRVDPGRYQISYAPPWLVPEHLKMDYEMLHFKLLSVGKEFAEIIVNKSNGRKAYVDRYAGKITYWPEFLLNAHSLEFLPGKSQMPRLKALDHSNAVTTAFKYMRPLRIKDEWVQVELLDAEMKAVDKAWIRWKEHGVFLLRYSLLS